ncbi:hypothetical protein [Marinobacter sp.]|uniref:hypothetical protein n=1 Tax=Marinobacter sp. TaxID=50741 RepID=UPI003B523471
MGSLLQGEWSQVRGQNNMFRGSQPTWANACVGENGSPSFVEYAKGFSTAANLLIEKALSCRSIEYSVDELIYPICFNMRHSVELRLKGTVYWLKELSKHRQRLPKFNFESSHDLGKIWRFIKDHAILIDKRYKFYIDSLDNYISSLSDVDPTGQTFRYPTNQESEKHLTEISIINVVVLKEAFSEMERLLDELNIFNEDLFQEYEQGTFTRKLSRHEIYCLAKELPPRDAWQEDEFKGVKETAKEYFGLSSNDFSKAIREIERNFEMAAFIEKTPPLEDIDSEQLMSFFDSWILVHDLSEVQSPAKSCRVYSLGSDNMLKEMIEDSETTNRALKLVSSKVGIKAIGELKALYYFAYDLGYSERYRHIAEREKRTLAALKDGGQDQYEDAVLHLIDKTDAFQKVITSLLFLNQNSVANDAISRYELPETLEWLQPARNRKPCSHLSALGYDSWAEVDSWLTPRR